MEEMITTNCDENEVKAIAAGRYVKKWDHLAIRPSTFKKFNGLKDNKKSADAFVNELIALHEKKLAFLKKKMVPTSPCAVREPLREKQNV